MAVCFEERGMRLRARADREPVSVVEASSQLSGNDPAKDPGDWGGWTTCDCAAESASVRERERERE